MRVILTIILLILIAPIQTDAQDKNRTFDATSASGKDVIRAIGVSAPNQDEYSATTAAKVIAMANLLSTIESTFIERIIKYKGNQVVEEEIRTRVQGTLVGASSCGSKYYADKGYAEVCVEIKLNGKGGLYAALHPFTFRKAENGQQYEFTGLHADEQTPTRQK
jgi:hypothetical protein